MTPQIHKGMSKVESNMINEEMVVGHGSLEYTCTNRYLIDFYPC